MGTRVFPGDVLTTFGTTALTSTGLEHDAAELTSGCLVGADLRGIHSHGLLRLPLYVTALRSGGINPRPALRWTRENGATAVLDADGALGQVAMNAAVERVARLARENGAGVVAVQNSTHYGAGVHWTHQLADAGFAALVTSTTGPAVAPHGGTGTLLGTNPFTATAPSADENHLTADMATSAGAYGKVVAARNENREIPAGWAVDAEGRPTTDPGAALGGALLPFGAAKGSALSVLIEALSASLTTASFAHQTQDIWVEASSRMNTGHLVIALDTDAFTGRAHTEHRVSHLQERVRSSSRAGTRVYAPGDIEHETARRAGEGVPLASSTVDLLDTLAEDLGLSPLSACA